MKSIHSFQIPDSWLSIQTIDMHTGGEPLRVILDGFPAIEGSSVLEYRRFIRDRYDHLRTALMFEPRGHADMYGVIVTPSKIADFGVVFIHNEGYSTMCGHATIAIAKLAIEAGWIAVQGAQVVEMSIEAPCGVLKAQVSLTNGKPDHVSFLNVPSFVVALNETIDIPELGTITYDLAYGGAYYAFVDIRQTGLQCTPACYQELIATGMRIKHAIMASALKIQHPIEEDLSFLYGTIFIDKSTERGVDSRNVCVFAAGEVDRSPTGSGVSARMAIHHKRGELAIGENMRIESILGTTFDCKVTEVVDYHGIEAVIPEVSGTAYVTGKHTFTIDPDDPLKEGFILR